MNLPFILIFDIDNAIIGNVSICLNEYYLLELISNVCKKKNIHNVTCDKELLNFDTVMKEGLLRPDTKKFIDFCKNKYKHVELFIYTNSTYSWTNNALVKNIEKSLGHKFNRPYFTRESSIAEMNYKKSLSNIYDSILNVMIKKYPNMKNIKNQKEVFANRLIMIDDKKDNLFDYSTKLITCPKYNYTPYYDLYIKMIEQYNISKDVFNDPSILKFFEDNYLPIHNQNGSINQKDMMMYNLTSLWNIRRSELTKTKDTFFIDLIKIMEKYNSLNDANIAKINKEINQLSLSS